ncbi:hypothetical protein [Desulfovibrio gilichinskyi]|uniref:Uncharacterized protein n=1 Tax=Desulfovibrio gilichinskyi TaxID=1519643 RepID=A0A1X7E0P4_9BACT|nr:hypothetical protein [Desulfovibrio gilichinskyi]SMF24938.1 hypothetical protein SAMN06295933_2423 [Desulfovibrio gilichinskyi]
MGSPSAELNVLESLRPWYQNGLSFIFKDALPGLAQIEQAVKQKSLNTGSGPQSSSLHAHVPVQGAAQTQTQVQPRQSSPQANSNNGQQSSPVSRAAATPMPSHLKQSTPPLKPSRIPPRPVKEPTPPMCHPDAGSWPDPWCQLASRITNRLQIFWTYPQLGQDLSGDADPARRKLFQSLIGYMGLPKGAISFWPCTAWNGNVLENRPDIFWKGVEAYGVKFVACFGSQGLSIIAPEAPSGASSAHVNGIQVIVLQDPDLLKVLPADEQQLLSIALLRLPLF